MIPAEITVLIAEDHPLYRKGLRSTLEAEGRFRIVGEASTGEEALRLLGLAPDLLILDLELGDMNGVRVLEEIRRRNLRTKTLVLSAHVDDELVHGVLEAGAAGYLLKNEPESRLVEGLEHLIAGDDGWCSPRVVQVLMKSMPSSERSLEPEVPLLSQREEDVVAELAQGKTNQEIAGQLGISMNTVKSHMTRILRKLDLPNRVAATAWALRRKR